jgi:hypothetical protein
MTVPQEFVRDLAAVGLSLNSSWELVSIREPYRAAVPVLLAWLDRAEVDVPGSERSKFREGLVRSLAVKEARGVAAPALLREFQPNWLRLRLPLGCGQLPEGGFRRSSVRRHRRACP